MEASFTFIYILVALNSSFIASHYIIRSLREVVSTELERGARDQTSPSLSNDSKTRQGRSETSWIHNVAGWSKGAFRWFMALLFDVMPRTQETTRTFPQWQELPYKAGNVITAILIVVAAIVLSDKVVLGAVGVSFHQASASTDFCVQDDFQRKIAHFKEEMYNLTNLPITRRQHNYTLEFHRALVADTALYGVDPYVCKDVNGLSGNKSDWADPTVPPSSLNGPFFPGYCSAALDSAIASAKVATCEREECLCIKKWVTCCWCGKVCYKVPYACPRHSDDEEAELTNYRVAQLERAEERRLALMNETPPLYVEELQSFGSETAKKILWQIDIAGTLYALYSAFAIFFPSPLRVFRMPTSVMIKRYMFGVNKHLFMLFVVAIWWGIEYFQRIMTPEVSLYFVNMLRDPCLLDADFIVARHQVIADICEELVPMQSEFSASALTIGHVLEEVQFFVNSCDCAFPNQHLSSFASPTFVTIDSAMEIGFDRQVLGLCTSSTDNCTIMAPNNDISFLGNTTLCVDTDFASLLAVNPSDSDANWWELWFQAGLVAQILIKFVLVNFGIALYRLADPLSSCAGQCFWPAPGCFSYQKQQQDRMSTFAEEHINTAPRISSFGLLLLLRKFVYGDNSAPPPGAEMIMDTEEDYMKRLGDENRNYLHVSARKWAIIWGFLTQSCLINFVIAIVTGKQRQDLTSATDIVTACSILISCVAGAVMVTLGVLYLLKRRMAMVTTTATGGDELTLPKSPSSPTSYAQEGA